MRNTVHIIISIFMWCLFAYYWYLVVSRQINFASVQALAVLAVVTLVGLLITIWWIAHNKRLASKNRRRQPPTPVPEWFETDHLGVTLVGPGLEILRDAAAITIKMDAEGQKVYAVSDGVGD